MMEIGKPPSKIAEEQGLLRIEDKKTIQKYVDQVFIENVKAVEDAKEDPNAINFLIGQVMKLTKGRCDPELTNKIIKNKLKEIK